MNLLIKGLTIPKNVESFSIKINAFPDVTYYRTMFSASSLISGQCKIFIMPEKYGRLIDEAQAQKNIEDFVRGWCKDTKNDFNKYRDFVGVFVGLIKQAPTIIEAEQGDG